MADSCQDTAYRADANDPNIAVEPNDPNAVWVDGDYHLLPFSLCIDAGDPNYIAEPNEKDLDGNLRIIGLAIDMGAYEANPIEANLRMLPRVLNPQSSRRYTIATVRLPEHIKRSDIDKDEPLVLYPGQIEADRQYILGGRSGLEAVDDGFGHLGQRRSGSAGLFERDCPDHNT